MACEHEMVVSPDPASADREIVKCAKCGRLRVRVAAAAVVPLSEAEALEMVRHGIVRAQPETETIAALRADLDALKARVEALEAR